MSRPYRTELMWFGWSSAGHVERVDGEGIATEFFHVVIPVWPRAGSEYRYRTREGEPAYLPIRRYRRSVVLGLLRTPTWLAAVILLAGGLTDRARWPLVPIAIALAALGGVLTFAFGRLDWEERDRRAMLRRVTGIGAPPALLPPAMRDAVRDELAAAWFDQHRTEWSDAIRAGIASEALIVLADYHDDARLLSAARANLIAAEGN